jgi:hypothetical protein
MHDRRPIHAPTRSSAGFQRPRLSTLALRCWVILAFLTGCDAILHIEETKLVKAEKECSGPPVAATAGEPDGLGWWSGCAEATGCFSVAAPTIADRLPGSTSEVEPFFFANAGTNIGTLDQEGKLDGDAWQRIGFDLDGVCSQSRTCGAVGTQGSCAPRLANESPDGEYCRDNQLGLLQYSMESLSFGGEAFTAGSRELACAYCRGDFSLLYKVSGYNGEANDESVRVDLFPSLGRESRPQLDCKTPHDLPERCWAADDRWYIDAQYVDGGKVGEDLGKQDSRFYDPAAYVRDHWLIIRLPDNTPLGQVSHYADAASVLRLALTQGIVAVYLQEGPDGWAGVRSLIGGRVRRTDVLHEVKRLGVCEETQPVLAAIAVSMVDSAADLLSNGSNSPDTMCDAISVGISQRLGGRVTPGLITAAPEAPPSPCLP